MHTKKQATIVTPEAPNPKSKELSEWKLKLDKFNYIKDSHPDEVRAMYFSYFVDPPPIGTPFIMMSIRLSYYLWRKSVGEEVWERQKSEVKLSYHASQRLDENGLSQNLQDIVSVQKEAEKMSKVKVKKEGNGHSKVSSDGNGGGGKKVFGQPQKVGKIKGLPISQTWVHYLTLNHLTDEEILKEMLKEFPSTTGIGINQGRLTSYRAHYNRGGYNKGIPPKLQVKKVENEKPEPKKTEKQSEKKITVKA